MNFLNFFKILIFILSPLIFVYADIECKNTKIWGPGLDPENIIMPARYFFIETFNNNKSRFNISPGKDVFTIEIFSNLKPCRIWINILDRKDGSLIVRYKIYENCVKIIISIKCYGHQIDNFPYYFKGITYPDECFCNLKDNIDDWLNTYGCKKNYQQISSDLDQFDEINFNEILPVVEKKLLNEPNRFSICNYVIKNNSIHRFCYGQYTGFKMFIDAILLFITRKVRLPDLEMLVNLGDWPLIENSVNFNNKTVLIPMFSWCGSESTKDIVFPTYDITESSLENMGRVTLDMLSVQGNIDRTWKEKISKLFWRGRDSNRERLKLIKIGKENEHLINASLTNFFFFKDLINEYGPQQDRISFFKFFDFKYQMNVDGTVAAYRLPYLLISDSLLFKQDSPYYEHFYSNLKKWEHFIPVKRDLSDLIEKIEWAIANDEKAHSIALQGQNYARNNLLPQDIFCYHVQLLNEYSKKLINKEVKVKPNMEVVHQKNHSFCHCNYDIFHDEL